MKRITISIRNWDFYNPRKDRKNHTWFRLQNTTFSSPDLFGASMAAKWTWVCLLSVASQKQNQIIDLDLAWLAHHVDLMLSCEQMGDIIEELRDRDLLTITDRLPSGNQVVTDRLPGGYQSVASGITTNEQTDRRTDTGKDVVVASVFFVDLINAHSKTALRAKSILPTNLTPREREAANRLWADYPDPEYWHDVMFAAGQSDFLCGKTDRKFTFTLAFLLKPETHGRIMDGHYASHEQQEKKRKPKYIWPEGGLNG